MPVTTNERAVVSGPTSPVTSTVGGRSVEASPATSLAPPSPALSLCGTRSVDPPSAAASPAASGDVELPGGDDEQAARRASESGASRFMVRRRLQGARRPVEAVFPEKSCPTDDDLATPLSGPPR